MMFDMSTINALKNISFTGSFKVINYNIEVYVVFYRGNLERGLPMQTS